MWPSEGELIRAEALVHQITKDYPAYRAEQIILALILLKKENNE